MTDFFYPYDPESTTRIQETHTIEDGIVVLRHIPKLNSIVIDGFEEVYSLNLLPNQFFSHYSLNTYYRESNRTLVFSEHAEGRVVEVSYIVVGTPILASDMNEIKAHLEGSTLEGGANNFSVGNGLSLVDGTLSCTLEGADNLNYGRFRGADKPTDKVPFDFYTDDSWFEGEPLPAQGLRLWDGFNWRQYSSNCQVPALFSEYISGDNQRLPGDIWEDTDRQHLQLQSFGGRSFYIDTPAILHELAFILENEPDALEKLQRLLEQA